MYRTEMAAQRRFNNCEEDAIEMKLVYCTFLDKAIVPKRMSLGAAGYDIHSCEEKTVDIEPGSQKMIRTGVGVVIPKGYYGRIAPRSSLAVSNGIDVMAGVIDSDYRGELRVILRNHGKYHYSVSYGDRIAQLILEKISLPEIEVVRMTPPEFEKAYSTERGAGGFGSTGK
jgi:dUTP pyrophosphatase